MDFFFSWGVRYFQFLSLVVKSIKVELWGKGTKSLESSSPPPPASPPPSPPPLPHHYPQPLTPPPHTPLLRTLHLPGWLTAICSILGRINYFAIIPSAALRGLWQNTEFSLKFRKDVWRALYCHIPQKHGRKPSSVMNYSNPFCS